MMISKYKMLALTILGSMGLYAQAQDMATVASKIVTAQYGFENSGDITGWKVKGSKLSFTKAHYKQGQQALQWDWQSGSILEIADLKGLKEACDFYAGGIPEYYEVAYYQKGHYGGVKMWLYQEKPSNAKAVFQVGSNLKAAQNNPKYRFTVNLDFTGWRAVWVGFEEDAKVEGYQGSDEMSALIVKPINGKKGTLYIDHFMLLNFISNKRHSDLQFVNNKRKDLRSGDGYEILLPYQQYGNASYPVLTDVKPLEEVSQKITNRLEFLMIGDNTSDWKQRTSGFEKELEGRIQAAYKYYDKLNLKPYGNNVNGLPLFGIRDEHPAAEGLVFEDAAQATMFPLAMDYRLNGNKMAKDKIISALDYFLDQGFASGSALGSVDHVIKMSPIASGIFLMQKELKQQNKLKPQVDMLLWHTRIGSLLDIDKTRSENSDKIRGGAVAKLMAILMMGNDGRKQALLEDFKEYMDYVIGIAPGYGDTFKPDFSIFHHRGTYMNTYGTNALNTMAMVHWLLSDTPYALSKASTENIKKALVRQTEIAYGVEIHYGIGGRFPLNNSSIDSYSFPAYAFMSLNDEQVVDVNMASLFNYIYSIAQPKKVNAMLNPGLTYSGTFGTMDLMVRLHNQMGQKIWKPQDGTTVMPYSGLLTYRKGNAFAAVKGYNKYVWDFEGGNKENLLGRYLSHGMLTVAQGDEKLGFSGMGTEMNNGYDWSMLPGATTKMLPADKALYTPSPDQKYLEGKHRNFSESVVASGLSQNGNGIFALDLRDDVGPDSNKTLFDDSFRARKSYFFIGNEVICLGSDINNNDSRYATVTTLFQYAFKDKKTNHFNGQQIGNGLNIHNNVDGGYLTDQNGLHYIVPKGNNMVVQQAQQSVYQSVKGAYQKVEAPYLKAWLDHGKQPKDKGYEYEILLNTPTNDVQQYLKRKTYEVWRKDATAHIVHHIGTGITAYAMFTAANDLKGPIAKTDAPLMAMFSEKNGRALLTIANPDLQMPKWNHNMSVMPDEIVNGDTKGQIISVTINGLWYPTQQLTTILGYEHKNGKTIIQFFTKYGTSINLPLQHRSASTDGD